MRESFRKGFGSGRDKGQSRDRKFFSASPDFALTAVFLTWWDLLGSAQELGRRDGRMFTPGSPRYYSSMGDHVAISKNTRSLRIQHELRHRPQSRSGSGMNSTQSLTLLHAAPDAVCPSLSLCQWGWVEGLVGKGHGWPKGQCAHLPCQVLL